ncbi:MAG TPA: hypothetical protein VF144_05125 [Chitinophagaceae bacterium]
MKIYLSAFLLMAALSSSGQELFPYSEPASNMPAKSLALKMGAMLGEGAHGKGLGQRYTPEVMFGLSKKWMVHGAITLSNMYENFFYYESARVYAKYRFLSNDDVHKHFRMAAFATAAYSRNHLQHNELNLMGDHSGIQAGIIATQLWNKLAVSGTASLIEVFDEARNNKPPEYAFESFNYSLSAGYLLFPRNYKDYDQTNLNLYFEVLGARNLDWEYEKYYIDFAPSLQLIFKSTSKLNLGYRFQVKSDIYRNMEDSWMISYEHIFLNALKKKKK